MSKTANVGCAGSETRDSESACEYSKGLRVDNKTKQKLNKKHGGVANSRSQIMAGLPRDGGRTPETFFARTEGGRKGWMSKRTSQVVFALKS